ncbi:Oidioi.mRNA.OKI2018_I69.PAR.g8766.t1.cds [Oikopleura dioica]|uniref:Oidioi.mRNA.OKI2018_I69.PAR.g8766.t1.cds n=1 Tax=Oikopleura dioica TaxID=34765 RepID=A0ABN7RL06_OIKDI|nr:Oidioi.mRNA.OKI2018_I69.PAR.g8766.t1.cds [Oikopleura dioica]
MLMKIQTSVSTFRQVQYHFLQTLTALEQQLEDEPQNVNSIKQLGLSLQTLGDKKIELLANIQEILDDATEELKLEPSPRKPKSPENPKIEALTSPVSASSPKHSYKHISSGTKGRRKKEHKEKKEISPKAHKTKSEKPPKAGGKGDFWPEKVKIPKPVDPNEETYCFCQQVSYGNMIGCDSSKCQYGWFHFSCVRINSKPKGKWFCPACKPAKTPGRGRKRKDSEISA